MSQQFQIHCKDCGNVEVIDYNPSQEKPWICICKLKDQPGQFNVCSNHNFRWWGSSGDCIKCIEERANGYAKNLNNIHIDYQLIGPWGKNSKPVNHFEREGKAKERAFDLEQRRIKEEQAWKKAQKDSVYALVQLPKLLQSIESKLDKLLEQKEGFVVN